MSYEEMAAMINGERDKAEAQKAEISKTVKLQDRTNYSQSKDCKNRLPKTTGGWMQEMERTERY